MNINTYKWSFSLIFLLMLSLRFTLSAQDKETIKLADPTIFYYKGIYHLYGTVENSWDGGFKVYTSRDKINWVDGGIVLKNGDAFGTKGFWAPQVFEYRKKFYMAYVANENIAIAESNSPLGPFKQKFKKSIDAPVRMIDPFVFFDKGKIYLYHVRLDNGNRIFVAEMNSDLSSIKEESAKECISATEFWEDTQKVSWTVTEGPTVLKRNGLYYLFYSANDFRNPDYAVGYATSNNPVGPWSKYKGNPILSQKNTKVNGSGHGDFFVDKTGMLNYVFHTHESNEKTGKRKTAVISAEFIKDNKGLEILKVEDNTFKFLYR
ncbi:glycoside hydrolase family 43 protein [Pedobacter aquatilis]|uniref:glycoside hydrolase family 43 protein n=1 Tax=Pedobacter aquatilis TaxID=351343 RepID=UPI0025B4EFBB|nr:glycoside hydrolase family 43 protein [Pedobacter aquatilis]MDN3586467.1 glycoside hydrolase family 43 protein [Pedobacter aquatilis]